MFRRVLSGAAGALGLFHVWLFVRQASAGELASPETLGKWLAAAGLIAALAALRRQGVSLVGGRKAVAIWTLAALLHAPAIGERIDAIAQVAEAIVALAPAAGALLLLWAARARVSRAPLSPLAIASANAAATPARALLTTFTFAPRPPPAL